MSISISDDIVMVPHRDRNARSLKEIGKRLLAVRKSLQLDQTAFAKRAGIKQNTYSQYENGTRQPSVNAANSLADEYDLTLDFIFRGDYSSLVEKIGRRIRDQYSRL